ncbi:MAG: sugar phosphate isomerase/epimerase [Chloroflexi bacterium]|nr:sugar phosphate isomerase/epimerase [Chloroflexota bacterium]
MKLAYCSATPEVHLMPLAWIAPLETVLPVLASLGYDGVELQTRDPDQFSAVAVRKQIQATGLRCSAISTGPIGGEDGLYMVHPDESVRAGAVARFKRALELAAELGVDAALGSVRGRLTNAPAPSTGWEWFRAAVDELVRHAERLGNRVVLEPQCRINSDFLSTIGETCDFIDRVGSRHLSFEADTYHMALEERALCAALIRGRRHMTYVQLGDSNRLAPGQGFLPWREILEALEALDYDGWLSMEFSQKPDSRTAAGQAIAFLRPLLAR